MTQASSSAAPASSKDAILVVDDEAPLLEMYTHALSPYFEVVTA